MASSEELIAVFKDTEQYYHQNKTLSDSVMKSHTGTVLYAPDNYPELGASYYKDACKVTVTGNRTYEAAMKLHGKNPDQKIAVLNFASPARPGGGVKHGSHAQEECLCRCSTLYATLDRKWLWSKYYDPNRLSHNALSTDACIYSPGVVIFKTDMDLPKLMQEKDWVYVDVISCAAPNLSRKPFNKYNPLKADPITLTDVEQYQVHLKRAKHILHIAAYHREDSLVLGAFGCGAFRNNPMAVAKAWHDAVDQYKNYFEEIEFAVYCKPGEESENYKAFRDEFSGEGTDVIKEDSDNGKADTDNGPAKKPIVIGIPKPTEKKITAKKSDWKTVDMPAKHAVFTLHRTFTKEEIANLRFGNIPQEMEDKWFIYMEGNILYAHRSWTGFCNYMVVIFPDGDSHEVIVNRDPEQYTNTDIEFDRDRLNHLLDWWSQPSYDYYGEWLSETYASMLQAAKEKDKAEAELKRKSETALKAIRGDITKVTDVQAIVNAANRSLLGGGGVDGAIHRAAGKGLQDECRSLHGCDTGGAVITGAYKLPCDYVIHTVGPVWNGGSHHEAEKLASCYRRSLEVAMENNIRTIAFPSISTGAYRFPVDKAAQIAVDTVEKFIEDHPGQFDLVEWVLFDDRTFKEYESWNERPRCKHSSVHWTLDSLRERGIRAASLYGSLSNKLS